ncbi:D-alanyl-D-alanine carboxypeptidase [Alteromonadaceae bacterium Bs31]|nr:D-alanyl-D-alanine carboxypeptidase [Alteromonadaceae bacterium Bs31]
MTRIFGTLFCLLMLTTGYSHGAPETCSYSTYKWNVKQKKAVEFKEVSHPYSQLTPFEFDELSGCSVCREDQRAIQVGNLPVVLVCHRFAALLENSLNRLLEQGEPIHKLVAYRVGMTRGDVDENHNRTRFSNHSFGIAIDINDEQNGLYGECLSFGPQCVLRKGGKWDITNPASLTSSSPIVTHLRALGFEWGGEIAGNQKDFMHFSPSGY